MHDGYRSALILARSRGRKAAQPRNLKLQRSDPRTQGLKFLGPARSTCLPLMFCVGFETLPHENYSNAICTIKACSSPFSTHEDQ